MREAAAGSRTVCRIAGRLSVPEVSPDEVPDDGPLCAGDSAAAGLASVDAALPLSSGSEPLLDAVCGVPSEWAAYFS